jgi:pimeloyl-ACP methyl ester carboxylesterase
MDTSSGERMHRINGVDLCVETFGRPADPAILLIAGAAASMLWWPAELCERIAAGGRFVIRYDNRDTGRSTAYPPERPGYSFTDLAADAVGILDALGTDETPIARAHVVGQSWAGGIALAAAVDHTERVASLTFLSSSTGGEDLPAPTAAVTGHHPAEPDPANRADVVEYVVGVARAYSGSSPYFDETATRALVERDVTRTRNVAATLTNHYMAKMDGPRTGGFADVTVPTLVVHGDLDPLLPLAHGEALRDAVPGARLVVLHGAGHDLPEPLWDVFVKALIEHTV